jgi:hypothetical protein
MVRAELNSIWERCDIMMMGDKSGFGFFL